jgi:hypothetical protein
MCSSIKCHSLDFAVFVTLIGIEESKTLDSLYEVFFL